MCVCVCVCVCVCKYNVRCVCSYTELIMFVVVEKEDTRSQWILCGRGTCMYPVWYCTGTVLAYIRFYRNVAMSHETRADAKLQLCVSPTGAFLSLAGGRPKKTLRTVVAPTFVFDRLHQSVSSFVLCFPTQNRQN